MRISVNIHRKGVQMEKETSKIPVLMNGEATTDAPR